MRRRLDQAGEVCEPHRAAAAAAAVHELAAAPLGLAVAVKADVTVERLVILAGGVHRGGDRPGGRIWSRESLQPALAPLASNNRFRWPSAGHHTIMD